jgi:hypothetical protein
VNNIVRAEREKRLAAKEARNWEREQLLLDRLLTPNLIRLAIAAGILAYSTEVTRSKKKYGPIPSVLAIAGPGIGIPLIAADAGIRDKYALAAISAAGLGYAGLSTFGGWKDVGIVGGPGIWDQFVDLPVTLTEQLEGLFSAINPFD